MSESYRCCPHCPESIHGLHLVPCMICAADTQRRGTGECDCSRCQTEGCTANDLCSCCLKAEIERLVTELADRDRRIQRVREVCDDERFSQCSCGRCPIQVDARDILRALDGDA